MKRLIFFIAFTILGLGLFAQQTKELPKDYKRNTIKWNPTPFLIWSSSNLNFSYERVLSPYRSFSVNAGYFVLPSLGVYDSLNIKADRKKWGFSVSGDYRFYFKKRNKLFAPDGLYFGPYGSFHHTEFSNDIEVLHGDIANGNILLDAKLNIFSAGVQLGYQFVIKDRFTLDLILLGPSLSVYSGQLTLGGDLTVDENNEYLQAIRDILLNKYPFLDELSTKGSFTESGVSTSFGFGVRYMIQIGYRF